MNVLVTGGAGFIGTNFVRHMVDVGHNVTILDKLTYAGGRDNLESMGKKVKLVVGDVCDAQVTAKCLKNQDWVVHFAAESHNTRSETDPDIFYHTNVTGTMVMLEQSFKSKVKRFIHISTDEVYGSIDDGYFAENDKSPGDDQATSAYSKSKSQADDIANRWGREGYPVIITRTTNNFGPWQFPEKALPRWITNLLLGQKIPLWGKGLQVRDWLFAPTNAQAISFLLENGVNGEVYNVAANHKPEITNKQAARWLCEFLNKEPSDWIEFIPDPRPNHDFRYALNIDKISKLGWKPELKPYDEFVQTVQWYQSNQDWWRKRKSQAESIYIKEKR